MDQRHATVMAARKRGIRHADSTGFIINCLLVTYVDFKMALKVKDHDHRQRRSSYTTVAVCSNVDMS